MTNDLNVQSDPVVYRIDISDRIIAVNEEWDRFAVANSAEHLFSRLVVGQPIWNYISNIETQHVYRLLFGQIRSGRTAVTLGFRCDSPDLRRFMEMVVSSPRPGTIEISSRVVRTEQRDSIEVISTSDELKAWITLCSWCKRARTNGGWFELEVALPLLDPFKAHDFPAVTHGVCPECQERLETELRGYPGGN